MIASVRPSYALARYAFRPASLVRPAAAASRSAHTTETGSTTGSHETDGTPEDLENEKQRNLKGETKSPMGHAPKWNSKLASTSESTIKAEKDSRSPQEMQQDTVSHLADESAGLAKEAARLANKAKEVSKEAKEVAKEQVGM